MKKIVKQFWRLSRIYWWPWAYLGGLLVVIIICETAWGEYPFDVSEVMLNVFNQNSWLVNELTVSLMLLVFAGHPILVSAWLARIQYCRLRREHPRLTPARRSVQLYFALMITLAYLLNLAPTFSCRNALCDLLPAASSLPGILVIQPLAQLLDSSLNAAFGGPVIDLSWLLALPNATLVFLLVWYKLIPRAQLPAFLHRKRWVVSLAAGGVVVWLVLVYLYFDSYFLRLSNDDLRSLVQRHEPADLPADPLDFEIQVGDVIIERPQGAPQDMMAKLAGTNLAHTEVYCGNGLVVSANGMDQVDTGGIMREYYEPGQRRISGAIPNRIVMRLPGGQEQAAAMCERLLAIAADDSYTFGLDLLGRRQHFNCTNIVLYQLDPSSHPGIAFNFVGPDYLFVYLLTHGWQLVNWSN